MRIIFFNIWHGHEWGRLSDFLIKESFKTDVFCFLEVDPKVQAKIQNILLGFNFVYYKGVKDFDGVPEGRTVFVSKKIVIKKSKKISLYRTYKKDTGGLSRIDIQIGDKKLFIGAVHGKARPGTKLDTPLRLKQSHLLINQFKNINYPVIIGGDFNLLPNTESVKMFEKAGYRDLIKEFNIQNTRNKLNWNKDPEMIKKFGKQYFADYCFVSPKVKVINFEVPNIEASDHEPLILDFEI